MSKYLIYSREHNRWWKAGGWGYTVHMKEAGQFTYEEAKKICDNGNRFIKHYELEGPNEFMVEIAD